MFLLLCRHLSGSQRINIALAWVQKLSPSADTHQCFVIPSGTTSPVLPLLHSPLTRVSSPALSCASMGPFSASRAALKERITKILPCSIVPTWAPWFLIHFTMLRRCLLSPSYLLLYGSPLTFHPHSTLEHAVLRSMKRPAQNQVTLLAKPVG